MTYRETIAWLFKQLPMYQRQGKVAFKKNLNNTLALSEYLNHPEDKFSVIHIAGTNGKGSVAHMLASVLQEADYKTGLYTSPHLKDFRERIRLNGQMVPEKFVVDFIAQHRSFLEKQRLSFFEMTVGMALSFFAHSKVDVAVVETGLGGRLDSTNIVDPVLSVITNIGFDHTQFLGETLPQIATEKAGIIKPGKPVVIGEKNRLTTPVFKEKAREMKAPIHFAEDQEATPQLYSDLKGRYQTKNIKTALVTIEVLKTIGWQIKGQAVKQGLKSIQKNTGLRGRWEVLDHRPTVICDTAHNREGLQEVITQLLQESFDSLHFVLGFVNDKNLNRLLPLFPTAANYYFCKPDVPRGLKAESLKETAITFNLDGQAYTSVAEAYRSAQQEADTTDLIFVGGSTFTVAEVL